MKKAKEQQELEKDIQNEVKLEFDRIKQALRLFNALQLDGMSWEENEVAKSAVPYIGMEDAQIKSRIETKIRAKRGREKSKNAVGSTKAKRKGLLARMARRRNNKKETGISVG